MKHPGTVIIRTNQERETFRLFLHSLWSTLLDGSRVIFIDDGSRYSVRDLVVESRPSRLDGCHVSVFEQETPQGCGACVNLGLKHLEGEVLFIIDTDVILLESWQKRFSALLAGDDRLGAVGGVLQYPQTGGVQHCGIAFSDDIGRHLFLNSRPEWVGCNRIEVQVVVFAFCALSKKAIDAVGPIDENFFNAYEDFDYCLRIRDAGYKILVDPETQAYHWELSNGPHRSVNRKRNLGRFWRLWGDRIEPDLWRFSERRLVETLRSSASDGGDPLALVDLCEERPEARRFREVLEGCSEVRLSGDKDLSHRVGSRQEIWLPQVLGVDGHRWPDRLLFFVDNFVRLQGNRYWSEMRKSVRSDDLIADLYGNVVALEHLDRGAWPGIKIR